MSFQLAALSLQGSFLTALILILVFFSGLLVLLLIAWGTLTGFTNLSKLDILPDFPSFFTGIKERLTSSRSLKGLITDWAQGVSSLVVSLKTGFTVLLPFTLIGTNSSIGGVIANDNKNNGIAGKRGEDLILSGTFGKSIRHFTPLSIYEEFSGNLTLPQVYDLLPTSLKGYDFRYCMSSFTESSLLSRPSLLDLTEYFSDFPATVDDSTLSSNNSEIPRSYNGISSCDNTERESENHLKIHIYGEYNGKKARTLNYNTERFIKKSVDVLSSSANRGLVEKFELLHKISLEFLNKCFSEFVVYCSKPGQPDFEEVKYTLVNQKYPDIESFTLSDFLSIYGKKESSFTYNIGVKLKYSGFLDMYPDKYFVNFSNLDLDLYESLLDRAVTEGCKESGFLNNKGYWCKKVVWLNEDCYCIVPTLRFTHFKDSENLVNNEELLCLTYDFIKNNKIYEGSSMHSFIGWFKSEYFDNSKFNFKLNVLEEFNKNVCYMQPFEEEYKEILLKGVSSKVVDLKNFTNINFDKINYEKFFNSEIKEVS